MKRTENLAVYTQEDLRKDIIKALFGEKAVLGKDYVDFHYNDEPDAGLLVNFHDENNSFASKTFLIKIRDITDAEVAKEDL